MQTIRVKIISGATYDIAPEEFEVVESKTESIAKGKCFLHFFSNDHFYEISKSEFHKVCEALDMYEVAHG